MQVGPRFHEDASNLEQLVPFEECIQLHSSDKAVVRAPEYLLLTHNGRSFKLVHIAFSFLYGLGPEILCGNLDLQSLNPVFWWSIFLTFDLT